MARRYGASNLRIFGSVARGEDTETSDIDLLVDLPDGPTLLALAGLAQELSDLVGVKVDVATTDILREEIRDHALRHAFLP
ncbi:MAG TPA: nucleotidyltransferase family protein [Gaiellaceae bacterium]|nr:nucleotidyltransferase family protein [Gaiellaceae bacterium]